ncbi:MAG: twin-arginine translocation signal domain-containing protein [Acidobacteriia bacterium]|nr:twin-arginine translocation signal domain-containing protein [Terriglobia bacterium]
MAKLKKVAVDRRNFLKSAAAGAAVLAANPGTVAAQQAELRRNDPLTMSPKVETGISSNVEVLTADRTGSDFMVDVIKSLGFEYVCANPGSSFRGLQESIINYGGNKNPEFLTCCHEESAVAMAHGYAKVEGKPLLVLAHGTVGVQHASMGIYDAYCDRVPVYIILGNIIDETKRMPGVEWTHSVQDAAAMVRDFTKWDDLPISLEHFAESTVRAYKIAMTPPTLPVVIVADGELQENPIPADAKFHIPKLVRAVPPVGDTGAVAEAARLLVAAENPVILADRAARTPAGLAHLIELAEALQASVVDLGGRMNFPTRHPLNQTERNRALVAAADVILGLEVGDFYGATHSYRDQMSGRTFHSITRPDAKLISIYANDLYIKSNYQDFERYTEVDLPIAADAEATLPSLTEAVKHLINDDRKRAFQARGAKLAAAHQKALEEARDAAAFAWDASPISTARLSAELWAQIRDLDWSLVSETSFVSRWPQRLWSFDKHYQFIGGAGGYGEGYGAPAAVGAALANRKYGRLSVNIQKDGDLMYAPGVLWTAAHHKIPLLSVMHNNRAYHQEVMHVEIMAARHSRGISNCNIGTSITAPNIDYASLARSMGVHGEGPISDPKDLGPAIRRALDVVKQGEPALIDVVTQPR